MTLFDRAHECVPISGHRLRLVLGLVAATVPCRSAAAQVPAADTARVPADTVRAPRTAADKAWYERLSLRGYTQVRYNGLFRTNDALTCPQCDRSIGPNGGLFVRRARLVLSGDVSDRVSMYIQPDLASEVSGALHFAQLRDAYFDLALDAAKAFRVRVGQSKIPFGWENLQSSSNRLPLDRADGLNSAIPNERDLAVIVYWAPPHIRQRFRTLVERGLKGTGDYGVVAAGVFNGQTANRAEANENLHTVLRVSYPFLLGSSQFVELGVQGYRGRYVLPSGLRSAGLIAPSAFDDQRLAVSFVLYPQPFGLQAEWNVGHGPEFDPATQTTRKRSLYGGYAQAMYRVQSGGQVLIPFARAQRYVGGKKLELDARRYRVRELEVGMEWLPLAAFELTAMYTIADREYEDLANLDNRQKGEFLRLQAQFNY
jgi:hypothetical protein